MRQNPDPNFRTKRKLIRGTPSVITEFQHAGFVFQIFAQSIPVQEPSTYRHMLIEAMILNSCRHCGCP